MKNEGLILRQTIDLSPLKIDAIIYKTGISRGQLYNLMEQKAIKDKWKIRIAKLNLNIDWDHDFPESTESTKNTQSAGGPGKDEWNRVLTLFERMVDMVEKDNKIMTGIIQTGLDEGAIRFDRNPKQTVTKK